MPFTYDKHQLLKTYCTVVEFHSFTKAADYLSMPLSSVSKQIKQLEKQLNIQLIIRSTRAMKLTDAGRIYFEKGKEILKSHTQLENEITNLKNNNQGILRISMPLTLGESIISPLLARFSLAYPTINLILDYSHKQNSLIAEDYDVIFRTNTKLPDSNYFEVKLYELKTIYVASPNYIKQNGEPNSHHDLKTHHQLRFQTNVNQIVNGQIVSNSYQALITAAQLGCGILRTYDKLVEHALENNTLVRVLKNTAIEQKHLSMIYRQKSQENQLVHLLIAYMKNALSA